MNCQETRKWISPYLDSELGQTKTFEVSQHLQRCPSCAARFESERRADEMIRERLAGAEMPADLWERLSYAVSTPTWVRRLRAHRRLALAACVGLAVLGASAVFWQTRGTGDAPLVQAFLAAAPEGLPFEPGLIGSDKVEQVIFDELGVRLDLSSLSDETEHFDLQLVDANRQTDRQGRPYLEVRMNCCGKPVLLALGRASDADEPGLLHRWVQENGAELSTTRNGKIQIAARRLGGIVAVAASQHSVAHIVESIRVG